MQRVTALVPRPRLHLIRFHGALAPSVTNDAKLRAMVVPAGPDEHASSSEHTAPARGCAHRRSTYMSWVRLLKRVVKIDLEHSPNCGGDPKNITCILEAAMIERIPIRIVRLAPRTAALGPRTRKVVGLLWVVQQLSRI